MIAEAISKNYFGHESLRHNQKEVISSILSKVNTLAILPTGGGKSLCYQVAAMCLPGLTLVISPLISLMQNQVQVLRAKNIPAAYINSSISKEFSELILDDAVKGKYKLIYVTPERLLNAEFTEKMRQCQVSMIAIDEAHCLSQWGHNFRKDYMKIPDFIERLEQNVIVSAFTATANTTVEKDILKILRLNEVNVFRSPFDRPNLYLNVIHTKNKYSELINYIKANPEKSGIIYCSTRKDADKVFMKLTKDKIRSVKYHGGMTESERSLSQDKFIFNAVPVMVATNAFGMGIDKSDVRYVIHYNMPKDIESYYQETGRAGRDGKYAECILLYSAADYKINQAMISESMEYNATEKLNQMADYCFTNKCLRGYITEYFEGKKQIYRCNSCSNCTNEEIVSFRINIEAKIIECIKELPFPYGKAMICQILTGQKNDRISKLKYNKLKSYGALKSTPTKDIYDTLDKMENSGQIKISEGEYPTVSVV